MSDQIDYELLELFDDVAALSNLEVNSLDEMYRDIFEELISDPNVHLEEIMEDVPVDDVPVQGVSVQDVHVQDVPVQDVPVQDVSVQDVSVQDVPVQDVRVQNVPVEDKPAPVNDRRETEAVFAVPKIYTCMYCYKRFYSQSAIRRHQVCHAKRQLQCTYCKKKSYNVHILRRHNEYFHEYAKHKHVLIQA